MAREIHHRSYWGNTNPEGYGEVYYDDSATNKLYRHSDYYENSWDTDKTLRDLNNKASIVLTPTAYSDGSLNTVIPPYAPSYILNLPYVASEWSPTEGWSIDETNNKIVAEATWTDINKGCTYGGLGNVGKTVRVSFDAVVTAGSFHMYRPIGSGTISESGSYSFTATAEGSLLRFRNRSTDFAGEIFNIKYEVIEEADFDFSRGSSATRVNEQGLVEDVQILSGELVQNGNFEQIGSELVTNGNFETDSDWDLRRAVIENGVGKFQESVGTYARIRQDINFTGQVKVTYTISFNNSSNTTISLRSYGGGDNEPISAAVGTHTVYKNFTSDGISFQTGGLASDEEIHLDNVSVKEVGQNWTFGTGWSMGDGKVVADGTMSASNNLIQHYNFIDGNKYRFSFTISDYQSGSIFIRQPFSGGADAVSANGTFTFDYIAGSANEIRFRSNDGFIGSLDNVSYKEVTDDTDLPRIDFTDGTGSLLLEPQRTNLVPYSERFDESVSDNRFNYRVTTVENSVISPSGDLNATSLIEDSNTNTHVMRNTISITSGLAYAFSVFAKLKSGDRYLRLNLGNVNNMATFDTVNKTVVNTNNAEGSIQEFENNWVRLSVTGTITNSAHNQFDLRLIDSTTGDELYTGDGTSGFYVWGAQLEQGSYATSYIPTSGSSVTRSADVANNSGNADLFNDSEGVLYAEIAALADDGTGRRISISDNSSNPDNLVSIALSVYTDTIIGRVRSANTEVAFLTAASQTQTQNNKIAVLYKQNDFRLFINGTQVATDTSGNTPTGLVNLSFDRGNGNDDFYGNVKCIAVFKEALSNDLLERLTGEGYESFRLLAEANNYTII